MDQVYNSMLYMAQAMAERQTAKQPAQTQERDTFQDQMRQAAGQSDKTAEKTDAAAQDQPREDQAATAEDPRELERQMALAALAVMQNPVVPAEQVALPEEQAVETVAPVEAAPVETAQIPQEAPRQAAETVELAEEPQPQETRTDTARVKDTERPAEAAARTGESGVRVEKAPESSGAEQENNDPNAPKEGMEEAPVFQDVREIPVKVGEAPGAAETREVPVADQVGSRLTEALKAGETRVEIQLAPENLGKVTVEVTLREDGALHVAIHAENSHTHSLLERNTDSLAALLGRETRQEVQVEVPRQQESQQQNFYDGQQGHEHQGRQQQHRQERHSGEDFLHQLRLGLLPVDGETA